MSLKKVLNEVSAHLNTAMTLTSGFLAANLLLPEDLNKFYSNIIFTGLGIGSSLAYKHIKRVYKNLNIKQKTKTLINLLVLTSLALPSYINFNKQVQPKKPQQVITQKQIKPVKKQKKSTLYTFVMDFDKNYHSFINTYKQKKKNTLNHDLFFKRKKSLEISANEFIKLANKNTKTLEFLIYEYHNKMNNNFKDYADIASKIPKQELATMYKIFEDYGLPKELALISVLESKFKPNAKSYAGAYGLFQQTDANAKDYIGDNRFNKKKDAKYYDERRSFYFSAEGAAKFLQKTKNQIIDTVKKQNKKINNRDLISLMLARYNGGYFSDFLSKTKKSEKITYSNFLKYLAKRTKRIIESNHVNYQNKTYTKIKIKKGDSISKIKKEYNIKNAELLYMKNNKISKIPHVIYKGDYLLVETSKIREKLPSSVQENLSYPLRFYALLARLYKQDSEVLKTEPKNYFKVINANDYKKHRSKIMPEYNKHLPSKFLKHNNYNVPDRYRFLLRIKH